MIDDKVQSPREIARALKRKNAEEERVRQERLTAKIHAAHEEVQQLVRRFQEEDPGLRRIILFGSLGEGRVKREDFDIDLAFEGANYLRCLAIALQSNFKVDLIDMNSAAEGLRREIEHYGREVYRGEHR